MSFTNSKFEFYEGLFEFLHRDRFESLLAIKLVEIYKTDCDYAGYWRTRTEPGAPPIVGITQPDVTYSDLKFWHEHAGAHIARPDMVKREEITKHAFQDLSIQIRHAKTRELLERWLKFSHMTKDSFGHCFRMDDLGGGYTEVRIITNDASWIRSLSEPISRNAPFDEYSHLSTIEEK